MRAALAMTVLAGCAPATPDAPTWLADVRPILAANCIRCHGSPAIGGAPGSFRLDVYDDTHVLGARSMARYIAARDDEPPRGAQLSGRQREILDRWAEDGAPLGAKVRNTPPTVEVTDLGMDKGIVSLGVLVLDGDNDLVDGQLQVGWWVVGALHAGRQQLHWDTSFMEPGTYEVLALVDDGSGLRQLQLGTRTVEHADTAPNFVLISPTQDELLRGRTTIRFQVLDPDPGDGGRLTLNAVHADQTIEIAAGLKPKQIEDNLVEWDTGAIPEGNGWRIEARFTDSGGAAAPPRFVSWPFIVSRAQTTETFETIKPIIERSCVGCHAEAQHAFFRERPGLAWRRVWQLREDPPKSARTLLGEGAALSEADRARLAGWLLAGAP